MSKSQERAMETYPVEICGYTVECRVGAKPEPQDWNEERRKCFQEGYETAEKDLALTWEDIKEIQHLLDVVWSEQEITAPIDEDTIYKEALKRFKKTKQLL